MPFCTFAKIQFVIKNLAQLKRFDSKFFIYFTRTEPFSLFLRKIAQQSDMAETFRCLKMVRGDKNLWLKYFSKPLILKTYTDKVSGIARRPDREIFNSPSIVNRDAIVISSFGKHFFTSYRTELYRVSQTKSMTIRAICSRPMDSSVPHYHKGRECKFFGTDDCLPKLNEK